MFDSSDKALEYIEEGLLLKLDAYRAHEDGWSVAHFAEAWGMTPEECAILGRHLEPRGFKLGEVVFEEGEESRSMYLLSRGAADVVLWIPEERRHRRVATFTPGTILGEIALVDGQPRAATVVTTEPLDVFELTYEAFERLTAEHTLIAMKIQRAISRILGARVRGANRMIMELDS